MVAILQTIFWNAFSWKKVVMIWLKFHWLVPTNPITNRLVLVQIMDWHWICDKTSETMTVGLLTCICITLPQWFNGFLGQQSPGIALSNAGWEWEFIFHRIYGLLASCYNQPLCYLQNRVGLLKKMQHFWPHTEGKIFEYRKQVLKLW